MEGFFGTLIVMRILVIYRPNSERGSLAESFMADYKRRNPEQTIEAVNADTREGIAIITMYDIVDYPAIIVIDSQGIVQNMWTGESLPLIDEVAGYARA
jgi:hypothetical protein